MVDEHGSALSAGDRDGVSFVAGDVSRGDAVGAAAVSQGKRRTGRRVEGAMGVTEQDGDSILKRMGDVALIGDDD